MSSQDLADSLILPVGTKVVSRIALLLESGSAQLPEGSVGVVSKTPNKTSKFYTVEFADGRTASFERSQLTILKQMQSAAFTKNLEPSQSELRQYIIYKCIVGSTAFGLSNDQSDIDRRGIYLPPAPLHWGLAGVPEQLDFPESEECYFEIQKFITLALKANPNILECLYTPLVEYKSDLVTELLEMKDCFLSKLVYQTYNGYVLSQFKKLEQDIRTTGTLKWKHAMHLIRLLLSGVAILKQHFVPVEVKDHREHLLAIKAGQQSWSQVNEWRLSLHREFENAFRDSTLPEHPDYTKANEFLIKARRSAL